MDNKILFDYERYGTINIILYTLWYVHKVLNNLFLCKQDKQELDFSDFTVNSNKFTYTVMLIMVITLCGLVITPLTLQVIQYCVNLVSL